MAEPDPSPGGWLIEDIRDATGRPNKDLTVRVALDDDGHWDVVITVPPPGTARLTGRQMSRFIAQCQEARDEVFRREP